MSKKGRRWTAAEYGSTKNSASMTLATLSLLVSAAAIFLTSGDFIPALIGWPLAAVGFVVGISAVMLPILRRNRVTDFQPSKINTAYGRTSDDSAEPAHPWFSKGQQSHVWLLTAPQAADEQAGRATAQLDSALVQVVGPQKPTWYFRLEKTGYLILFVPGVIVFVGCLLAGVPIVGTLVAAGIAMVWLGYPLAGALQNLARRQAAQEATATVDPVLQKTSALVRPAQPGNVRAISTALQHGADPATVQALAFRAAGTDADADRAAADLVHRAGSSPRA